MFKAKTADDKRDMGAKPGFFQSIGKDAMMRDIEKGGCFGTPIQLQRRAEAHSMEDQCARSLPF
jgi:hypothetical protein